MEFPYVLEVFFLILFMKLCCWIFAGGRPRALSKLPLENQKNQNLHLVDGFPLCFGGFFGILLMKWRRFIFGGGRPRALSKFPLKTSQNSKSELGRWISPTFWRFFLDFAYEISLLHFCRGEAQGT